MQRRPLILVSLLIAAFVINLDITIVNVALPTLVRELHASNSQLQWVVDAYSLVFASLLLAAGSLSDRLGRHRLLRPDQLHDLAFEVAELGQAIIHVRTLGF